MRSVLMLAILLAGLQATAPVSVAAATQQLSERTYEQLSRIHTLMERERYADALAALERLKPRAERRPYEHAVLLQTYAHVHARQARYPQAIAALQQCLALDALPEDAGQQALYLLAQLQLATGDHLAASASLERWFGREAKPSPAAHALAGTAHAHARRYPRAIEHLRKAIAQARDPDENWYRQLLAVYYESREYQAAAQLLQQLIRRSPDTRDHWLQLAGVYHELGDDRQAIAVMELAYLRGLLNGEAELLNLARYYLYTDQPFQAGQVLERALREGVVRSNAEHWRLLADVWVRAREPQRALAATDQALKERPGNAELHLLRARLLAEQEVWPAVIQATAAALQDTELEAPGQASLLQGFAHFQLGAWQQARASFERAGKFDDTRAQAARWLEHLDAERGPAP